MLRWIVLNWIELAFVLIQIVFVTSFLLMMKSWMTKSLAMRARAY